MAEAQWWQNAQTIGSIDRNIGRSPRSPGGGLDPGLNRSQVDQAGLQIEGQLGFGSLDLQNRMFDMDVQQRNEVLAMIQPFLKGGGISVPEEFAQNVDLFQPGGQFGAASKAEIDMGAQAAIQASISRMGKEGTSQGTFSTAIERNALLGAGIARGKVEEDRLAGLSGALTTSGQAGLNAQQLRAQQEAARIRTLSSFG